MKSKETAIRNYEAGIKRFGVDNYAVCGDKEGWYAVAECLHEAKKASISVEGMVSRYRDAA